jgi:amino acid adenylation domain-containing protein
MQVNWAFFTPSTISLLHPDEVPSLRTVSVGGEPITQDCIDTWASRVRLYNSYGPTEACVFCCIASTEPTTSRSVIGHAVGCQAWIVDPNDHNKLASIGQVGELLIEGEILARGYLNDPEKTATAYITGVSWANCHDTSVTPRRFYKTGDLARFNPDGTISCLGRRDKQVKIRGQRVELGDIESNIKQQVGDQVQNVYVELVRKNAIECLVAFLVFRPLRCMITVKEEWQSWCDDLRTKLAKTLPAYMVPGELVPLQEIPMNTSGKVDRAALQERFKELHTPETLVKQPQARGSVLHDEHGRFEMEVARVLSLTPSVVDTSRTFLDLGGNSLLAIRLVSRLRKANLHLSTQDILQPISLSALAVMAEGATSETFTTLAPEGQTLSYDLTPDDLMSLRSAVATQCGVTLSSIESLQLCTPFQESLMPSLTSQPCTYVAQYTFRLPVDTDLFWFKTCWEVAYHNLPILRSRFVIDPGQGPLRAVVHHRISWNEESPSQLKDRMALGTMGMGTRLSAFALHDHGESHEFVLILHHLLFDEWSLQLCLEHVAHLYDRLEPPTPGPSFNQFVRFSIKATKDKSSEAFWNSQLSSACVAQFPRLPLPNYSPKLKASRTIRVKHVSLERARTSVLIRASLGLAMRVQTGLDDVCFGTVMSGRDLNIRGIDEIVGPTLATVPVRLTFDPSESISGFLGRIESQQQAMRAHEHFGLQNIRKTSTAASLACDFQTMLVIQAPSPADGTKYLFGAREEIEIRDSHALVLECTMTPELLIMEARFDTATISTTQCERFLGLWEHFLRQLSHVEGNITLGLLDQVSEADKRTLALWNSHVPLPSPGIVQDHLSIWSRAQPDRTAVDSWDGKLTYRELDILTSRFASILVAWSPNEIIPLHFPKGLPLVVSIWAVLKAGRAFLCLDTEAPADRLAQILEQLDRPLVLSHNSKSTHALASVDCWTIDRNYLAQLGWVDVGNSPLPPVSPHHTAYMIMTSGSTGCPKGVLIGHQSIMTTVAQSGPAWGIKRSSRMLQFSSVAFDAAVMEILSAVVHGACLCVPRQRLDLDALANFVKMKKINWAFFTPSFLRLVRSSELPGLETVVAGGEAMTTEAAGIWAPKVHLVNAYGPCECAITCAYTPVKVDSLNISSIGKAVGCALWIVDAENHERLAPIGTVGELLIEGPIVGRGYLNDNVKTAAAFLSPPAWTLEFARDFGRMYKTGDLVRYDDDGSLLYIGRKDNQVKLRGQRLELGEVEHNVRAAASSRPALCFVPTKGPFAKHLIAVLGVEPNNLVPVSEYRLIPLNLDEAMHNDIQRVRENVATKVPAYMVPERYAILRDMPISLSGKLDRKVVGTWIEQLTSKNETLFSAGVESQDSTNDAISLSPLERELQSVWAAVLGLPPNKVGATRSFQALGGDSITAMQAIARSRNKGIDITMKEILGGDSIRVLSRKSKPIVDLPSEHTRQETNQPGKLSPIQRAYSLLAPMDQAHYFNQSVQVQSRRYISLQELDTAMHAIVTRHASLRARYDFSDLSKPSQRVVKDVKQSYSVASSLIASKSDRVQRLQEVQMIPNPVVGPIIHCELIEEEVADQRLILVAPHLSVDIVSWKIILEDLETVLEGAALGPKPPVSYQDWCESVVLGKVSGQETPALDYSYWALDPGCLVYREVATKSFSLSRSTTELFLGPSNHSLRTRPTDLLVAAISWAFHKSFPDRRPPAVCIEGHGRQSVGNALDVSSTVGWFTTVMPVHVPEIPGEDLLQFCIRTKDARFRSENEGIDFFRAQDFSTRADLKIPEIMVNFTGIQRTDAAVGGLFVEDVDSSGDQYDFSANMRRFALFDIAVSVRNGELEFALSYDRRIPQSDRIGNWLFRCKSVLEELSSQLAATLPKPTLSDFPALSPSYDTLAALERDLQRLGVGMLEQPGVWAESIFPVTPMQSQMLRAQQENSKYWRVSMVFNICSRDQSPIDLQKLSAAWKKVVAANPTLRTILIPGPQKSADDFVNVVLRNSSLDDHVAISSSIDLSTGRTEWPLEIPQQHLTIVPHGAASVVCRLEISHALVDHASMSILFHCLSKAYENSSVDIDFVPYETYAMGLTHMHPDRSVDFWASYLGGAQTTRVSGVRRMNMREDGNLFSTPIDLDHISQSLIAASKACNVTSATIFRLAWALTLKTHTKNDDVTFGFVVSGRDIPVPNIDRVVGPVLNVVACRVGSSKSDMLETLKTMQEDFLTTSQHQRQLPTYLRRQANTENHDLFDTVVNCRRHGASTEEKDALIFTECPESEDPYEVMIPKDLERQSEPELTAFQYAVVLEIDSYDKSRTTATLTCWSDLISQELATQLAVEFRHSVERIMTSIDVR